MLEGLPVRVESIVVRKGRLICDVICDVSCRYSSRELAETLIERYPSLPGHACVNPYGPTFAAELPSASVPHVLEHLAIDEQVQATRDSDATFTGFTRWTDEASGKAVIELSFHDDLVALRAVSRALESLNRALSKTAVAQGKDNRCGESD